MFLLNGKMYGIPFCINFTKKQGSLRTLFLCKLTGFFVKISSGAAAASRATRPAQAGVYGKILPRIFSYKLYPKTKYNE